MSRLHVVCDTNVYRSIGVERFARLRALERSHSVRAVASPWVALELLAHMAPPHDHEFPPARSALKRLAEHCQTYNGAQHVLTFVGDAARQVAHSLLLHEVGEHESGANLASFVGAVVAGDIDHPAHASGWLEIAQQVREVEQGFVSNLWQNVIRSSVPDAQTWSGLLSSPTALSDALTQLHSQEALEILAGDVLQRAFAVAVSTQGAAGKADIELLLSRCGKPLRFEIILVSEVISRGLDLTKSQHRNTVWDIYIAVDTTMFGSLDPRPMWLITDDRLILRAAAIAEVSDVVVSLEQYERRLESDDLTSDIAAPPT